MADDKCIDCYAEACAHCYLESFNDQKQAQKKNSTKYNAREVRNEISKNAKKLITSEFSRSAEKLKVASGKTSSTFGIKKYPTK